MRSETIKTSYKKIITSLCVIFLVSFIIISPQIYQKYIVLGHDVTFHFNRFYDLYRQLETGHFNYFQTIYGFNSSGRIINALYGYDSAFFQACLLYVTKSWLKFQVISSFLCLATSGITMYALSKKIGVSNKLATISGILYMTSACVNYYIRYQSFTGWGAAFLPLIFIPAIRALKNKEKPIEPVYLAIPVTILMNVHIMSAVMGVLAIFPFYLVSFIQTKRKFGWLKNAFIAVLLTILMSINTLYSYYDVFSTNTLLSPFISKSMFLETFNLSLTEASFQKTAGIIFSTIFLFVIVFSISNWKNQSIEKKIIDSIGILFFILSSSLLPWDLIAKHFSFISVIQFPSRFSVIAYILFILSFFININNITHGLDYKIKSMAHTAILVLVLLSVVSVHNIMVENAKKWQDNPLAMGDNKHGLKVESMDEVRNNFRSNDLSKALNTISKGTPDYLPVSGEYSNEIIYKERAPYTRYKKEIIDNDVIDKKEILENGNISLTWTQENNEEVILPVFIYGNSTVIINGSKLSPSKVKKTEIGSLTVNANEGLNNVIIGYEPKINMKIILGIKFISIMGVIIYIILKKINTYR